MIIRTQQSFHSTGVVCKWIRIRRGIGTPLLSEPLCGYHCLESKNAIVFVKTTFANVKGTRPERTEGHIIFPRPHHLHRGFDLSGDQGRFMRIVRECLATKPASEEGHVYSNIFHRN